MPQVKPISKTIRAYIDSPTETNLKVRAIQMNTSKERLIGLILKEWCAKAHTQSEEFRQVRESLS